MLRFLTPLRAASIFLACGRRHQREICLEGDPGLARLPFALHEHARQSCSANLLIQPAHNDGFWHDSAVAQCPRWREQRTNIGARERPQRRRRVAIRARVEGARSILSAPRRCRSRTGGSKKQLCDVVIERCRHEVSILKRRVGAVAGTRGGAGLEGLDDHHAAAAAGHAGAGGLAASGSSPST